MSFVNFMTQYCDVTLLCSPEQMADRQAVSLADRPNLPLPIRAEPAPTTSPHMGRVLGCSGPYKAAHSPDSEATVRTSQVDGYSQFPLAQRRASEGLSTLCVFRCQGLGLEYWLFIQPSAWEIIAESFAVT